MTRTSLISLALLAASTAPAVADDSNAAGDFEVTMMLYKRALGELQDHWSTSLDERWPANGCKAAIDAAKAQGIPTKPEQEVMCEEYRRYHMLAEAERSVSEAKQWLYFLANIDMASNRESNGAKMIASAAKCSSEVDRMIAAGMPTDVVVRIGNSEPLNITMSEAKAKVCEPLAKAASTFAKDVGAARSERTEKIAKPYKAVGISGDRLELLVDHINYAMYGVGGGELRTPQQLKNAKVIFELLGPGTDGLYTLRRYQFSGNKLVGTTSREFILRPGAKFFR
jgi:hypothetical protein